MSNEKATARYAPQRDRSGGNPGASHDGTRNVHLSMKDVAARAGVALSSVSRVLSGHPDVSQVMRNRVLDAVAALGYEPNILAQSLRRGASMTVGFVVSDISNPLLSEIALGAELRLGAAGYSMILTNSVNDPELDVAHIRLFRQRRVDGLLLSLADETAPETQQALASADGPYVLVDRKVAAGTGGAVLSDHADGIIQATEHLIGLGHRTIALVNGNPRVRPAKERAQALRRAVRRHPDVSALVRSGAFSADFGETATRSLLAEQQPPTAIIAGGNQILVGVLRALRGAGLVLPDDLSLVTCDDVPLAEFLTPSVATISRDPEAIGSVAAELLLGMLGGEAPAVRVLPTSFRPAASCGPPRST